MLVDVGFIGFHLGYGKYWTLSYDPIFVYKKNPYIPILEMPAVAFYSLSNEQLLKIIKAEVMWSYEKYLYKAKDDFDRLMIFAAIDRENIKKLADRGARYKAKTALNMSIIKARNKIKKLTEKLDFYKNLVIV
jgi:hypothetical protein